MKRASKNRAPQYHRPRGSFTDSRTDLQCCRFCQRVTESALLAGRQYRQDFAVLQVFVNAAHRFMRRQKIHKPQHNTGASASNAPLHWTRTLPAKIFHARTKENNGNNGPSIQNQGLDYALSVRKL